jgi:hypothetical protein
MRNAERRENETTLQIWIARYTRDPNRRFGTSTETGS